jgi:hypothetical protein
MSNDSCKCGFRAPELGPHPACPVHAAASQSDVQRALDALDELLATGGGLSGLSDEDLAEVDAWANNIQLDIMPQDAPAEAHDGH